MVEAKGNSQCQGPKGDVTLACPAKKPGGRCGESGESGSRRGQGGDRQRVQGLLGLGKEVAFALSKVGAMEGSEWRREGM